MNNAGIVPPEATKLSKGAGVGAPSVGDGEGAGRGSASGAASGEEVGAEVSDPSYAMCIFIFWRLNIYTLFLGCGSSKSYLK